jgi:plasmid maintenance system antidote protein VapI
MRSHISVHRATIKYFSNSFVFKTRLRSKAFGSTPETWLHMQLAYDLAAARKDESKIKVRRQHLVELHA